MILINELDMEPFTFYFGVVQTTIGSVCALSLYEYIAYLA